MEIRASAHFERRYKKLPQEIKERAKKQEKLFVANRFDPRLSTHKLHGKDAYKWAYSVDYNYRIKFLFLESDKILYLDIGTHEEIY